MCGWPDPPVVLFVHQVVASAERHQVRVVGRRGDGDGARAADVGVAQLVGEQLELIRREAVVVPQDVVVGRTAGSLQGATERRWADGDSEQLADTLWGLEVKVHLDAGVAAQVEVKLVGVSDVRVHGGSGWDVPASADLNRSKHPSNEYRPSNICNHFKETGFYFWFRFKTFAKAGRIHSGMLMFVEMDVNKKNIFKYYYKKKKYFY